jgi:hypothetical protein
MLSSVALSAETLAISGKSPMKWTAARLESYGRADVVIPRKPTITLSSAEKASVEPCTSA